MDREEEEPGMGDEEPEEELEPVSDVETSPMMEPSSVLVCHIPSAGTPPHHYWQAQAFADDLHREFEECRDRGDAQGMRQHFFILANYYGRTLAILRKALSSGQQVLITAALRNLVSLHHPLHHMHEVAPVNVPFVVTLDRETRGMLLQDLIMEVLRDAIAPLAVEEITRRVNDLHFMVAAKPGIVETFLSNLGAKGHVRASEAGYAWTGRAYTTVDLDRASLQALLGMKLYREFERGGFSGVSGIRDRKEAFRQFFERFSGCGSAMADEFIATALELLGMPPSAAAATPWRHADLIGSLHPRPYQRDAFTIFRGYGYRGQVIESPHGSGKTLIGMMCIQDWLRTLPPGESILVLVPTMNYERQWVGELSYLPIGLQLSPDLIFTGTPADLEKERKRSGLAPAVVIMTYTSLAQVGSPVGKGGFDAIAIERFLQGNRIQYVILDEVHKVVDDVQSVTARVTRLLTEWLTDGSLRGVIGFSGTAAAYRDRFALLGLQLVYTIPAADLIAHGFVAPFAEFGVPFAHSEREKRIIGLIDAYKSGVLSYLALLGPAWLRTAFARIPMAERVAIGKDILGLATRSGEAEGSLERRFSAWESAPRLGLAELPMLSILQVAGNLSDEALVEQAALGRPMGESTGMSQGFREILREMEGIRGELAGLVHFDDIHNRLMADGFGTAFDGSALSALRTDVISATRRSRQVKNLLATTLSGLYPTLRSLHYRMGEGRVDSVKAIIDAEQSARGISGVIVFDNARGIPWEEGVTAIPGYTGVGGLFAQMLGDPRWTPMAATSREIYLPWREGDPLHERIADYIRDEILLTELGRALFGLITQGLDLHGAAREELGASLQALLKEYVETLSPVRAPRSGEFNRRVLRKFRRTLKAGHYGPAADRIRERLSPKNHHLTGWIQDFFDYALIAQHFREAMSAELRQAGGDLQRFSVVRMAEGDRKQLMYDLVARVVDAETLPISMIIVSTWARTGWNVITPNILIDATATRNVTAWQQLRGRAVRARRSWTREYATLTMRLLGTRLGGPPEAQDLAPDARVVGDDRADVEDADILDAGARQILLDLGKETGGMAARRGMAGRIRQGRLDLLEHDEREGLAADLMLAHNKVTHIYELLKAYGSAPQIHRDRKTGAWHRTESIAVKHAREYSVNPLTGEYGPGEAHAPLIFAGDPRRDSPGDLQEYLAAQLQGRDADIVHGWMRVVAGTEAERVPE